jgi:septum formation protein
MHRDRENISAAILHDVTESTVRFCELSEVEIGAHWPTGEPLGKAGAYAAQGLAAIFIEEIQGGYSAIMGRPFYKAAELLAEAGVEVLDLDI